MVTEKYQFKQKTTHHEMSQQYWQNNNCRVIVRGFQDSNFTWNIIPDTWNYIFLFLKVRKVTHSEKSHALRQSYKMKLNMLDLSAEACMHVMWIHECSSTLLSRKTLTYLKALFSSGALANTFTLLGD